MKHIPFIIRELHAKAVQFLNADPMFTGDRAAKRNALFEDGISEGLSARPFARNLAIEQDQGMHVAITGMKDIHATKPILVFEG